MIHESTTAAPLDLSARYTAAKCIAQEAANRGMDYYRRREELTVLNKSEDATDVVSVADRDLEDFIRQALTTLFPEDGLLGEERGSEGLDAQCVWVIDPIDGTACFVNGLHNWCVSIGLLVDGEPALGVIADPNHHELFHALKGQGAFVNDSPLKPHKATHVREGLVGVGTTHRPGKAHFLPFLTKLLEEGGMFFRSGSGALMTAYVAAGRLLGYHETRLYAWDCLAGIVMLNEVGGRTNDFLRGNALLEGGPFLAACPGVYEQLEAMTGNWIHEDA
ncbi:inositol monophosphatase family protein [Pseudomonas matsuisoli]|uniref:Nus factor SuhB n=1 Tax=Pseudomonas matsuisoli TaxID=1515666 RepID=A0A917V107_9PSED|nr:inositol monophosphatase [Pseudomonas matsuisoli]GGK06765.1 inositol monophosphatase [Pseudomonas matsuisoli]